jgi:hypothetical protein
MLRQHPKHEWWNNSSLFVKTINLLVVLRSFVLHVCCLNSTYKFFISISMVFMLFWFWNKETKIHCWYWGKFYMMHAIIIWGQTWLVSRDAIEKPWKALECVNTRFIKPNLHHVFPMYLFPCVMFHVLFFIGFLNVEILVQIFHFTTWTYKYLFSLISNF